MLGVIERIKNNVLLKCSTLNDEIVSDDLNKIIDTVIYRFAEELISIIGDLNLDVSEKSIREDVDDLISSLIVKKIKRKLFIDSLALQITNDSFIEDYVEEKITLNKLSSTYIKELNKNKQSNQLNMTEDLKMDKIIEKVRIYVGKNIISRINENEFLVNAVNKLVKKTKKEFEDDLEDMIKKADLRYKEILMDEIKKEIKQEEGEEASMEDINVKDVSLKETIEGEDSQEVINKFEKYDDMTLFNKVILSLNTREEKLSRNEDKQEKRKQQVDKKLSDTNKDIEANIERENKLSRRKLELNSREIELNSKLSEAEVIFLNMKPLIKGLNKISVSDSQGGNEDE